MRTDKVSMYRGMSVIFYFFFFVISAILYIDFLYILYIFFFSKSGDAANRMSAIFEFAPSIAQFYRSSFL